MSSVIFQPLLHDSLGWKTTNSTYADTYTWKKLRKVNKNKKFSPYGQQNQKQQQKQINTPLPLKINDEQTIEPVSLVKKNEENRGITPASNRSASSKVPSGVTEELPVLVVEYKQRPASTNREATCGSRASQRSPVAPAAAEETCRPATSIDARRSPKEEKEKEKEKVVVVDANNDNSRHWLTYPNPKTPQYLIDVKQRLGQLKISSTLARPTSASNASVDRQQQQQQQTPQPTERPESTHHQQQSGDERHFFDFNVPETPIEIRAARHRLDKHRYNPSLDNYPPRPKTCPVRQNDISKPLTPPIPSESDDEQSPMIQTTIPSTKDGAWDNDEEIKTTENSETPSIMVQMVDCDDLPIEYFEALEIAAAAQEEYLKSLKTNGEKRPDNPVYRLPSISSDNKTESFIAYRNQQQRSASVHNTSSRQNEFGTWVRNATDKERQSAMKILHDVLNKPIMGYDSPTKQQTVFKKAPAPPPVRTCSATRKLGRTRTHQRIPCEICEKQYIKRHVWDLSRSDTLICNHRAQGLKPPLNQVRT